MPRAVHSEFPFAIPTGHYSARRREEAREMRHWKWYWKVLVVLAILAWTYLVYPAPWHKLVRMLDEATPTEQELHDMNTDGEP
jgi:hypothetical protein